MDWLAHRIDSERISGRTSVFSPCSCCSGCSWSHHGHKPTSVELPRGYRISNHIRTHLRTDDSPLARPRASPCSPSAVRRSEMRSRWSPWISIAPSRIVPPAPHGRLSSLSRASSCGALLRQPAHDRHGFAAAPTLLSKQAHDAIVRQVGRRLRLRLTRLRCLRWLLGHAPGVRRVDDTVLVHPLSLPVCSTLLEPRFVCPGC